MGADSGPRLPTYEKDGYELDDGEEMHAAAPETFWLPDARRRRSLRPGEIVKLVFRMELLGDAKHLSVERMWVEIVEVGKSFYVGRIDNDPVGDVRVKADDRVTFEARHVIAVHED